MKLNNHFGPPPKSANGVWRRHSKSPGAAIASRFAILIFVFFALDPNAFAQSVPRDRSNESNLPAPSDAQESHQEVSPPSLMTPLKPQIQVAPYHAITPRQRLRWFVTNTVGPPHLVGGIFVSAFGTALDRPEEYGPHWGGFADRYGMRMTGIVTGNGIEAGVGVLFKEDPRYFRVPDRPLKARIANIVHLTFIARHDDGSYGPAYARYLAISGNNFLSNTWRASSEANTGNALLRTAEGFAGRMAVNAFEEFWPDVKMYLFHKRD